MQDISLKRQLTIFVNEVIDKRVAISIVFAVVALSLILVGIGWPKIYESEASILWSSRDPTQDILQQPVSREEMQVRIFDQIDIAREIIFSNKVLDEIVSKTGLDVGANGKPLNRQQLEMVKGHLKSSISVTNRGQKLLVFAFRDRSPELAYLVTSVATELFLRETRVVKNQASQGAYDFINRQVQDYKEKLDSINRRIIEFRQQNVDLDSDSRLGVSARVNTLKGSIREANLQLAEALVQKNSLEDQLQAERERIEEQLRQESQQASAQVRTSAYEERLQTLESNLDTLRLSYTENYPDIVQLKEQIRNLKAQIAADRENEPDGRAADNLPEANFVESQLYIRLAGEVAEAETTIQTLSARLADSESRLETELERASKVNALESQLEEMSRDLDVTQTIYDDLLTRRENARVSLNLQLESHGTRFRIQEPASVPIVPVGLRFIHFALGSIPLAGMFALALVFGLLFIDKRIRHEDAFEDEMLALPVIGVVDHYATRQDRRRERMHTFLSASVAVCTVAAIAVLVVLKVNQVIGF